MIIINIVLFIITCSLTVISKYLTTTFIYITNKLIDLINNLVYFRSNILSSKTCIFRIRKSTKIRLTIYFVIFSIFRNVPNNVQYFTNDYQFNYTNVLKPTNNTSELYYLFINFNIGYKVYSKNMSNNKKAKSYNGNINYNNKMIKYMQFNKSNSHFQNYKI